MYDDGVKKVILIIADISGYTEFMVSSQVEIEHSQKIISNLIQAIINCIDVPLEVAKLEGDAIFLYALKDSQSYSWEKVKQSLGARFINFFHMFRRKQLEIAQHNDCPCGACTNIDKLALKVVIHSGRALFYHIQQFSELSGEDVILVHRLLKNNVARKEYILMTDSAYADIEYPATVAVEPGQEIYEHLGKINTQIYYPPD